MKKLITIAIVFFVFMTSCIKNDVPEIHQQFTTNNLMFRLPPLPDSSLNYYVQVNVFKDTTATVSYIHFNSNQTMDKYDYRLNKETGNINALTVSSNYPITGIPVHDTIVNFRSIPFSIKSENKFGIENLWFTLPQSPNESLKYYVQVDVYSNHIAIVSYLNVQKDGIWNQYAYVVNADGIYISKHYTYNGLSSQIPKTDTIITYYKSPIFL